MDMAGGVVVGVVMFLSWMVPVVLVVYLFRTLGTIVDGLRSINAATQRIAAAVEQMARPTDS